MTSSSKCPYCSKAGKLTRARVAEIQTHFTFGWGEKIFKCSSCGETWSACYPIPPKGHSELVTAAKEIIEVGFVDGMQGFAAPLVFSASVKRPQPPTIEAAENPEPAGEEATS